MANKQVSGVDVEKIWYADYTAWDSLNAQVTGANVAALIAANTTKEIKNVHQDTWQIEETESSQDSYKNQLTGSVYRMGSKTMGEVQINFTIGRYDYQTKADLLGGEVILKSGDAVGWARARGTVDLRKIIIARTEDKQYIVLPYANINTREANTDGAIGLACNATAMEPQNELLSPELWFDESEVDS